jgi:phosphoribosyl 1,2-cyclic phosphate phosphodiesterase
VDYDEISRLLPAGVEPAYDGLVIELAGTSAP